MHLDPPRVADYFEQEPADHSSQVAPCSIADAEEDVDEKEGSEDGRVEGIAAERGDISDIGVGEGAGLEGA